MKTIIAIVGPSCSGKDTLLNELKMEYPKGNYIIQDTTRYPRKYEFSGQAYNFITFDQFVDNLKNDKYIEWTKFAQYKYYGTPIDTLKDGINIGIFNNKSIKILKRHEQDYNYKVIPVYCKTTDKLRIKRSINRENKLTYEMIRRFVSDKIDFKDFHKYLNQNFDKKIILPTVVIDSKTRTHLILKKLKQWSILDN